MKNITEAQRQKSLQQANDLMKLLEPVFDNGDIDEEQFKQAARLYTQAVIIRARLTSTKTLRGTQ